MNKFSVHLQALCESPANLGSDQICYAICVADQASRSSLFRSLEHVEAAHIRRNQVCILEEFEFWFNMVKTLAGFLAAMDDTDLNEFIATLHS